ncbi:hypothetical protein GCM10022233_78220 [Streptomyces shaanxiensis]|uniref:Uncharacterized protein n=1 Tax=Streptomyces shaanxiensis TaxID=653357 RepID=A0ABP7WA30_9ACTN
MRSGGMRASRTHSSPRAPKKVAYPSGTLLRKPFPGGRVRPVVSFAGAASTVALMLRL